MTLLILTTPLPDLLRALEQMHFPPLFVMFLAFLYRYGGVLYEEAAQLERATLAFSGHQGAMRAADHQFQQPLLVAVMGRQGAPGVKFDVEGSGYGFRVIKTIAPQRAEQPHSCKMARP